MIKYTPSHEIDSQLFETPFDQGLDMNSRWVILRREIPWDKLARVLMTSFPNNQGRSTINLRYVLAALIIQGLEDLTDEQTILRISENVYMQYFVGLPSFQKEMLFSPEVLCYTRKRLGKNGAQALNELFLQHSLEKGHLKHRKTYTKKSQEDRENIPEASHTSDPLTHEESDENSGDTPEEKIGNRGVLKVDATVAPSSVKYPLDTDLLNDARLASEQIIDVFWKSNAWAEIKPKTYRRTANKKVLNFRKNKKPSKRIIKKQKKYLLSCIKRNLNTIHSALDTNIALLNSLEFRMYRNLLVLQEIYRQQKTMFEKNASKISDRIVSLSQPWVRPMPRGKAAAKTEFGAQINMSETNGFVNFDTIDFNKFNEGNDLQAQVESYKRIFGYYPHSVLADKIYLTKANRTWLKERNILEYGPPLGRPTKTAKEDKQKRQKKQNKRSEIEGKFGQAKIKFGLGRIKTRAYHNSLAKIGIVALCLNIWKASQIFFASFLTLVLALAFPPTPYHLQNRPKSHI